MDKSFASATGTETKVTFGLHTRSFVVQVQLDDRLSACMGRSI